MNPKVSVLTTCYNQVGLVDRAIKSVAKQITGFEFEHIVVDDGSTDGSVEVIEGTPRAADNFCFFPMKHQGMMETYLFGFEQCSGEYIAFCDGDDYWIDPLKLQKQVDYMDSHPDCSLCITKVMTQHEGSDELIPMEVDASFVNRIMSFDSLLIGNAYIHAQSYLLRASCLYDINFEFFSRKFKLWDLPIVLELVNNNKIHCLDFYSAVFFKHKESMTNTRSRLKRLKYIMILNKIKLYFVRKYNCQSTTKFYLIYRFVRDIFSIILRRW